jgi:succinoglycan biosynthesis protein ExoM
MPDGTASDLISVCVCTFRRPNMLVKTLEGIAGQKTSPAFSYEIVVVDNDSTRSAEDTVLKFRANNSPNIWYDCEAIRSISHARNRTIKNAKGNLIAFIDDDEYPQNDWLINMYDAFKRSNASGILGPVKPSFDVTPPNWLVKSKILERKSLENMSVIKDAIHTRTGNVLVDRRLFDTEEAPFDPKYGRIGGGDTEFFRRMMLRGHSFVWCETGIVFETVTQDRYERMYYLRRAFVRGVANARQTRIFSGSTVKSIIASAIYSISLPFLLVLGHHHFMKVLIKDCDHIGKLLALIKIEPVKERPYKE